MTNKHAIKQKSLNRLNSIVFEHIIPRNAFPPIASFEGFLEMSLHLFLEYFWFLKCEG
jgi:hypothetical protein